MTSDGNWSRNPLNNLESLKKFALPKILFEECHKNCVDMDIAAPSNGVEMRCVKNCQEKSYQAFNMYMRVQHNFAQK